MKKKVYLDTTIPSYLFDNRDQIRFLIDITKKWWNEEQEKYDIATSDITINELSRGNFPEKDKILQFALELPLLPQKPEITDIAQVYVDNYLMPKDFEGDAMHLAYASFYRFDFLLTWNCNHLANANKKTHIRIINTKLGLFVPEIITPLELFEEDSFNVY